MHDLKKCVEECEQTLDRMGIPRGKVTEVKINTRAKCMWGKCSRRKDGTYSISISGRLLADSVPYNSLRQTVFHELLHAGTDLSGHMGEWKQHAERLNRDLGLNIKRTSTWEEKGIDRPDVPEPKYVFICRNCGQKVYRYRQSRFTQGYRFYRCGICKGKFDRIL